MLTDEISRPVLEKKGSMFWNRSRSPNLDALQMLYFINLRMLTEKSCPQNVHKRKSSQSAGEVGVAKEEVEVAQLSILLSILKKQS